MTCRGFIKLSLKAMNLLFFWVGLAMVGYGVYMLATRISSSSSSLSSSLLPSTTSSPPPLPSMAVTNTSHVPPALSFTKNFNMGDAVPILRLRRSLLQSPPSFELITPLLAVWSHTPSAWFLYVFIAVGIVITLIPCLGYIAATTTSGCFLSYYLFFLGLLMILELAFAGFVHFDQDWQEVFPQDSTGELANLENFIEDRMEIFKWVALVVILLQASAFLLAIILQTMGSAEVYDSDDEIFTPRASQQPPLNTSMPPEASTAGEENRPARRHDAWSTRMREKYGLDTVDFSYNPLNASRLGFSQQQPAIM